jgi:protein-S-isoprenylcysteine O-methyltransferase Ste14
MRINLLVLVVCTVWIVSEMILVVTKRSQKDTTRVGDRGSQKILWLAIVVSITVAVFAARTGFGTIPGSRGLWDVAGLVLIAGGLAIRWAAILTLKEFFTVDIAIAADHQIIDRGVYRFVRHPSYTGSLVSFLGLGITFANWLSILAIIIPITGAFMYRVHIEEAALREAFGDEYAKYASRTRRFVPFLSTM